MIFDRTTRQVAAVTFLSLAAILLGGCASSSATAPSLFVLDSGSLHATPGSHEAGAPTLMVMPVSTAAYLSKGGIVYQTQPHRVVIARDNRWASPLADQLTDDLRQTLDKELSGVNIVKANSRQDDAYLLDTEVDQFLGRYDGKAHIAGQWSLTSPGGQQIANRKFNETVPLKTDGYPALVDSLAQGWHNVGRKLAETLQRVLAAASDRKQG